MAVQSTRVRLSQALVDDAHAGDQRRARYWDLTVPGLVLNVTDKGAKSYGVIYRDLDGRQREPRIGDAKVITLKQARTAALDVLAGAQLHGRDPIAERRAARSQAETRRTRTLSKLAEAYFADSRPRKVPARITLETQSYGKHLRPRFGDAPVAELSSEEIGDALRAVAEMWGPGAANTCLEVIRQMLSFAVERGWVSQNAARGLRAFPKRSRERVATEAELRAVWRALDAARSDGRSDGYSAALALQLAILTLQRRSEVAGIDWREIDWAEKLWTIPGPRTKNKKGPHVVPLSPAALDVLKAAFGARKQGFAFSGRSDVSLDAKVVTRAFARLTANLGIENLTVHDLRRTGATMLTSERLGVLGEIVSRILNHTPPGPAITSVYNRNTYLPQKRAALDAWADEVRRISSAKSR